MVNRIDLLNGNIFKSLTQLAIPIVATSLMQVAYNMTDMIWIGRVGSNAVASVGAAGMFMWLAEGVVALCRSGGQVKVGQSLGANERATAVEYAKNALQLCIFLAILYSASMIIFSKPLIDYFMFTDKKVIADARNYLIVISIGLIFTFLNYVITGLITATGNSKTPFRSNAIGLITNILLDPIMIFGVGFIPPMGVIGAAIATVTAQAVVFVIYLNYLKNDDLFCAIKLLSKPNFKFIKQIIRIGFPPAAQSCMFTFISIYISRLIASFGEAAVAVQKVGSQIESISWMSADGLAASINSFIAQNYGAGNPDRVKKGYYTAFKISAALGAFTTFLLVVFPKQIFYIFIPEADILPMGVGYLVILGFSQLFMCLEIMTCGAFAGIGRTTASSIINVSFTLMRIPLALLLVELTHSLNGVWWALTISSILRGIIIPAMFMIKLKHIEKIIKPEIESVL